MHTATTTTPPHGCATCRARWGGSTTSHCIRCHHTFTSPSSFDKHQAGNECRPPATVGLTQLDRSGYTAWGRKNDNTTEWWTAA